MSATEGWKEYYRDPTKVPDLTTTGESGTCQFMQYQRLLLRMASEEIEKAIRRKGKVKVWSAGSGIDLVSLMLKQEYGDSIDLTISDISQECMHANRKLFEGGGVSAEFVVGDIFESEHDREFDVVMNTGLLEHFSKEDQERILAVISRSLAAGGSYLTLTPYSGGRLYAYFLGRAKSKGSLSWPEVPIATLRGLDHAGMTLIEEYPVCATDQLAMVNLANPALAIPLRAVRIIATRFERVGEPVLMKLIDGYCLFDRFTRA